MRPDLYSSVSTAALLLFACITLCACGGGGHGDSAALPPVPVDADACTTGPAQTPVDTAVCRGKANFHDRTLAGLGGNGRACSDCHMDSENFQLTPAAAQARFAQMTTTGVDDPLFRAIDADDFRVNGAAAHDFTNLTQNGLVRVTIPLPANVKLLDCGSKVPCPASALPTSETVADVWRSVPSIFDANITGPDGAGPALAARAEPERRLPARRPHRHAAEPGARARSAAMPGSRSTRPRGFLDDLAAFQSDAVLVTEREGAVRRDDCRHDPAARSRSGPERPGDGGQGGLQPRLCPVPRQHGRPSERQHADPAGHAGHADRPRPLPRHRDRVSQTGRQRRSAALLIRAMQREPDGERADLRDHEQRRRADRHALRRRLSPAARASPGSRRRIRAACCSPATRSPAAPATSSTWTSRTCAESAEPRRTS